MSEFCAFSFDGLGTKCDRCGSWHRGTEPPDCPPFVTRSEPDGIRLPDIKTTKQNAEARAKYFEKLERELEKTA